MSNGNDRKSNKFKAAVLVGALAIPAVVQAAPMPFVQYTFDNGLTNSGTGGSAYNAVASGGATTGPGGFNGNGLILSAAAASYITVPISNASLATGDSPTGANYTISATFLLDSSTTLGTREYVFENGDNYSVSFGTPSSVTAAQTTSTYIGYINQATTFTTPSLTTNAYHNITEVYSSNGTATTVTPYVDGTALTPVTVTVATNEIGSSTAASGLRFGDARSTTGARYFNGELDNIAIYNSALSATDVASYVGTVPEPTSVAVIGAAGLLATMRRRRTV